MTTTRHRIDKESVLPFRVSKCEEPREFVGGVRCQPRQPYVRGKMSGSAVGLPREPRSQVSEPRFNSFSARKPFQGEGSCGEATGRAKVIPQSPLSGLIARFSRLRQRIKPGVLRLPRLPTAVRAKALWICHFASTTSTLGGRCRCWFEKQPEGRSRKSAKGAGVGRRVHAGYAYDDETAGL